MTSRVATLLAVLALAVGCSSGGTRAPGGPLLDDAGCQVGCFKCAPLAWCVSTPYQPACLETCSKAGPCAGGGICAILDLDDDEPQPVCVMRTSLHQCRTLSCAIEPRCRDAQTLLRPLAFKDLICGWELVHCDSGCDSATAQCN
jgi:hypothetical protein